MHTATQLYPESFRCEIDGTHADLAELLPGWGPGDRFGIVVDRPLGTLGASLLVQAVVAAFYDLRRSRRIEAPSYPEIYAFHVGCPMGDHSAFDFWPPRKEVVVDSEAPVDLLAAVNAHAVTRLAVPEVPPGDLARLEEGPSTWVERESALERIVSCFGYSPDGMVDGADVTMRSEDPRVEQNVDATFDLLSRVESVLSDAAEGAAYSADTLRWAEQVRRRADEVPEEHLVRLRAARGEAAAAHGGTRVETYRRLTVPEALGRLTGLL